VVAWLEGASLYVKRWNGTDWKQLGGKLHTPPPTLSNNQPTGPEVAVGRTGVVALKWYAHLVGSAPPDQYLFVKRYNR